MISTSQPHVVAILKEHMRYDQHKSATCYGYTKRTRGMSQSHVMAILKEHMRYDQHKSATCYGYTVEIAVRSQSLGGQCTKKSPGLHVLQLHTQPLH